MYKTKINSSTSERPFFGMLSTDICSTGTFESQNYNNADRDDAKCILS